MMVPVPARTEIAAGDGVLPTETGSTVTAAELLVAEGQLPLVTTAL